MLKQNARLHVAIIALALALLLMLIIGTMQTGARVSPIAVPFVRPTLPGDLTPEAYAPLVGVNWSPLPTPIPPRPTP